MADSRDDDCNFAYFNAAEHAWLNHFARSPAPGSPGPDFPLWRLDLRTKDAERFMEVLAQCGDQAVAKHVNAHGGHQGM